MKKKVEISKLYDKVKNSNVSCLTVDGKHFGWGILEESLKKAKMAWQADPTIKDVVVTDIHRNFLEKLKKFIGKEDLTIKEVVDAIENGFIDV